MGDSAVHFSELEAAEHQANGVETGFDATAAFVFLGKISSEWREADRLDVLVLRAVCQLSIDQPHKATEGFPSWEIVEAVGSLRGKPWSSRDDKGQMSNDVLRYWNKLTETWNSKCEGITQLIGETGLWRIPQPAKTEGGGTGRPSLYRIDWLPLEQREPAEPASRDVPPAGTAMRALRYICDDIQEAGPLARIFTRGLRLTGWRRNLYIAFLAGPLLLCLLLITQIAFGVTMSLAVGSKTTLTSLLSFAFLCGVTLAAASPFFRLGTQRIVLAPWWMQSVDDDRLLEHRRPPRHPEKSIKAVRYTAICPICGGKIAAKSGGFEFWGRIVGRCAEAPVEHVYSFDHVTRSGRYLRE